MYVDGLEAEGSPHCGVYPGYWSRFVPMFGSGSSGFGDLRT